jgi:hypothetical protein
MQQSQLRAERRGKSHSSIYCSIIHTTTFNGQQDRLKHSHDHSPCLWNCIPFTAQPQAPAAQAGRLRSLTKQKPAPAAGRKQKNGIRDSTNATTREESPLNGLSTVARSSVIETVAISGWRIPPVQAPGEQTERTSQSPNRKFVA